MVVWQKHLNKLRWLVLLLVFCTLVLLPFLYLYQTYLAAHAYDLLASNDRRIYDAMEWLTQAFVKDPEIDLDVIKGTTWAGSLFGFTLSDPLAVLGQITASGAFYWSFFLTALIPIALTMIFGRFFCGWICPATFIYELNDSLATWLRKSGLPVGRRKLDRRVKYLVLLTGIVISGATGTVVFAAIYPPAIIGREIYYVIALNGFGAGMVFFIMTLLFDLMVTRRGFCRYVCPGGALYSLLGHFRLIRIKRDVAECNDCAKCNVVCQFGLDPWHDDFGQECNNCTACIAVCPTDALELTARFRDRTYQGVGHLGHAYRRQQEQLSQQES